MIKGTYKLTYNNSGGDSEKYLDYDGSFYNEYIHEVLTFLEENQDRYPDAYERAKHINEEMEESDSSIEERIAAEKMHGIVKGVVEMNKK